MTGLRCVPCGFTTTNIPERDIPRLRMPSATITCPRCRRTQPAADCWTAYEQWAAERRQGLKLQYQTPSQSLLSTSLKTGLVQGVRPWKRF